MLPRLPAGFLFVLFLVAAGCSGEGGRAAVSGKVTLDGQPLEQGRITFYPTDGNKGAAAGAAISNGTYKVPAANGVVPGKNRVEISGTRKTGKQVKSAYGETVDEVAEAVPAKYRGDKSELVRDIPAGSSEQNFELSSK